MLIIALLNNKTFSFTFLLSYVNSLKTRLIGSVFVYMELGKVLTD